MRLPKRIRLFITLSSNTQKSSSLVSSIVHNLAEAETAIVVAQFGFVEGLGLVKAEPVMRADLVCVLVGLRAPECAIPVLSVA